MRFDVQYVLVMAGLVVGAFSTADAGHPPQVTRQDLIGAWRLVDIEADGAGGREVDSFYGNGSRGLLIYDASGWFSVQIEGSGRPALQVPAVRPAPRPSEARARLNTAVLDSYYAYYGTWSFDPATASVTHHAKGALYPGEDGATYTQQVEMVGGRMIFARTQNVAGHSTVQSKRWERLSSE